IILKSVKFDNDHLHQFSYQNRFGTIERVNHSYMDEGPYTDERQIGDLPLRIGQTMVFLFDFGDNWEFDVTLEEVDEEKTLAKPVILESKGAAPPQYRSWGGDESDW
ncbi:MAG: plasmid pRiA4b ORF-3 family protein, partial [Chloroflexota bacterium]